METLGFLIIIFDRAIALDLHAYIFRLDTTLHSCGPLNPERTLPPGHHGSKVATTPT